MSAAFGEKKNSLLVKENLSKVKKAWPRTLILHAYLGATGAKDPKDSGNYSRDSLKRELE